MNCQLFNRYVFDYCDDNLSPALKEQMDKHQQECSHCHNQVKLTKLENQVLRDTSDLPTLSNNFTSRVMQQIMDSEQVAGIISRPARKPFNNKVRNIFISAAAVGLVFMLAVIVPKMLAPQQWSQVADAPPAGVQNQSFQDSTSQEMRSASRMLKEEEIDGNQGIAGNTSPINTTPEANVNSIDEAAPSDLPMAAASASDLSEQVTAETDSLPEVMYWKTHDVQSPSRQGINPTSDSKAVTEGVVPKPQQVPGDFTLTNIVNSDSDEEGSIVEYHYIDKNNRLLIIALNNLENQEQNTAMMSASISSEPLDTSEDMAKKQVEVSYNIDVAGQTYQVILNGTLSAEELGKLAEIISFSDNDAVSSP